MEKDPRDLGLDFVENCFILIDSVSRPGNVTVRDQLFSILFLFQGIVHGKGPTRPWIRFRRKLFYSN
jgi:hypothetical protein